tara:strand:+ start:255 stop:641 length:387 start_codon:yes stop_codon:yes gene_type:complete
MNLKKIFLIIFFSLLLSPSEVFSHPGSKRQCYDDPKTYRLSGDFSKAVEGEEPWWQGEEWNGGGKGRGPARQYKCMHGGFEKHKKNKGSKYCHTHHINDKKWPKSRQWWLSYDSAGQKGYLQRCRKTG